MGYRPSVANNDDDTLLVDQQLGAAYQTVKLVSENLETIQALGAQVSGLALIAASIEQLQYLITQIDNLTEISNEIADLTPILTNINALVAIHGSMASLLELHGDLDALNLLYTNMSTIISELVTVAGIASDVSTVAGNSANISIVAGLQSAINDVPALVMTAQQAAQDAQNAVASINLPIVSMPADAGKELFVDPDTGNYALRTPIAFMLPATYDPNNKAADAFDADNHSDGATNKVFTATEKTKLAGIETGADVTDAGNVGGAIHGSAAEIALDDADYVGIINSLGNVLAKISWSNLKASLKASAAEVYASTLNKFITTDMIASASTYVAMVDSATPTLNWESGINRELIISQNTKIMNPINGRPGTHRTVLVKGSSAVPRSVLFDDQFFGDLPEIDDCSDAKWYDITIKCISPAHFTAVSMVAKP